jgi:acyl-CoA synthetase (AMP-forming)/AMP-acid ligase II
MPSAHRSEPKAVVRFPSLLRLLEYQAKRVPAAPAILGPERAPLSYDLLYRKVEQVRRSLRAIGIGRDQRVAVALPNGPEMAIAALAVAACAACAPLNPAYTAEELDRYLGDLRVMALITETGTDSPARRVAISRGIRVVELDAEADLFALAGADQGLASDDPGRPDDVALLMLTSGTTSRPKVVPSTHANICAAAHSWGRALALTKEDRCLNVMPLFHGHGLIAVVLASLAAGASVICTSGYEAKGFFEWLPAFRTTWYSAVPTIHQAILAEARRHGESSAYRGLRFIRSGAAPLPPPVLAELERTFQAPVLEFCGITETAASPVACNPLPPQLRKPGSVGVPVSLEVAILDESEAFLSRGRTGQIVVRGPSVMAGYDSDPIATRDAFAGDWFKTGDLGFFDEDGYLFLVGRSKEIINRGGEKIAPREVDEVLLEHPMVAEAATFAVPHPTLGEDIAAAIVLRPDAAAMPDDIRRFAIGRVADFKVPSQVVIVSELPKGPTGKVQRVGLALKLGLAFPEAMPTTFVPPRTPIEKALAGLWAEILQCEQVGVHDNFFSLGGDSLLVAAVLASVHDAMQVELDASRFFHGPTVAEIARHIETLIQAGHAGQRYPRLVRVSRAHGVLPVSIAQERLCRLQCALPGLPFFTILYALRLTSLADTMLIERALNEIVRRHDILRTTFTAVDGSYAQVIAPQMTVCLAFDDLRALSEPKKEIVGHQIVQKEVLRNFDLAQGPLFRARLVCLAEREHLLLITMHQVVSDGWSLGVLAEEFLMLYEAYSAGAEPALPPLPIQYADFAYWQRQWQSHPEMMAQLEYWRRQLRDPLPVMQLATPVSTSAISDFRTARREMTLPENLVEAARRFANREAGTLFMTLVVALKTLLHHYLGHDELRVATLVANRNRSKTRALIGPLANTVILRSDLGGDPSPTEVMRRVRATTLTAFANQDLPFEALADTLMRERGLKPATLAQVMIILQNAPLRPDVSAGHILAFEEANPSMLVPLVTITTFDIVLMLRESRGGIVGSCVYKPHLFDGPSIDRLLRDFCLVIEQMTMEPNRLISSIRISNQEQSSIV